ncbi:HAD family hydrolase [Halorubrum sp. FL23]|uniref:HAD family hydrolase n=1 Tax=Halorubrum sp. FL23 TaxID=3458704 RepID=UPI004033660D
MRRCRFTPSGLECQKPNPQNIQIAMKTLGVENGLYIDDRQIDATAADNVGIESVLLRRHGSTSSSLSFEPTHVMSSLRELPNVVSRYDRC